jgi:diaminopimelate epimerase
MTISFEKYHGAGNDFILLDNRTEQYNQLTSTNIVDLCHRRFGIGADGLMMLNSHPNYDFAMRYFNSDGKESTYVVMAVVALRLLPNDLTSFKKMHTSSPSMVHTTLTYWLMAIFV